MKLRTKFLLFIVVIHLLLLALSFLVFGQNRIVFIISEIFIILSIIISIQLYNQLIQPLKLLIQGAEAIKDKDFNVKFSLTGKYEMDELIQVYNRMADELRAERTTREQQHFFLRKLIETSPTGILILDFDGNIQEANPKTLKLLDMNAEDLVGHPVDAVPHPLLQPVRQLKSGEAKAVTINGVNTFRLQKSHFIDQGFARHFILIEELTAEILSAEKKAYGKVIRMMAHEVNNTIGPVNSILQSTLASPRLWEGMAASPLRNALQVALDRNTSLTLFMKNFTEIVRLPDPRKTRFDLHQLIRSVGGFTAMMTGSKHVDFNYYFDDTSFFIEADEQQMEQVLINVVKNSIEAIDSQGIISFTTSAAPRQLVITDNGRGLPQEKAGQLFSPFFSTKKDGQGIGLTLVKEIMINHGFEFSLTSVNGETSFVFKFGSDSFS